MKTTNADDNPNHEQTERDRAEKRKQQADAGAAASTSGDRDAVERESKVGRGPAGLNTGPSNTSDANPRAAMVPGDRNPAASYPSAGSQGMGQSPPQGAQPTSDKPEPYTPEIARGHTAGTDEAREAGRKVQEERQHALQEGKDARADLRQAEKNIAENQSAGAGRESDQERKDREQRERNQRGY